MGCSPHPPYILRAAEPCGANPDGRAPGRALVNHQTWGFHHETRGLDHKNAEKTSDAMLNQHTKGLH